MKDVLRLSLREILLLTAVIAFFSFYVIRESANKNATGWALSHLKLAEHIEADFPSCKVKSYGGSSDGQINAELLVHGVSQSEVVDSITQCIRSRLSANGWANRVTHSVLSNGKTVFVSIFAQRVYSSRRIFIMTSHEPQLRDNGVVIHVLFTQL
jgi:hypothetical protein